MKKGIVETIDEYNKRDILSLTENELSEYLSAIFEFDNDIDFLVKALNDK